MSTSLKTLFAGIPLLRSTGNLNAPVTSICTDSRRVAPGSVFFALKGNRVNGNDYIDEAVIRGAIAVVSEDDGGVPPRAAYLRVTDARETLALVACRFYGNPQADLNLIGVTGTNGKTTVTTLLKFLLSEESTPVGLLGTVAYEVGKRTLPASRTTPDAVDLHAMLAQMKDASCKTAVMEVSSHGIDQHRVAGLEFDVVAFLNLTQDHIDYHRTMDDYYSVKRRLFTGETGSLPEHAVINLDDVYGHRLLGELPGDISPVTFGVHPDAAYRAEEITLLPTGSRFTLVYPGGRMEVISPLLGAYNVSNVLAALAIAGCQGRNVSALVQKLMRFAGVPGRMEKVSVGQSFNVLVDYAHTDDALKNALLMLRDITPGRLLVVFGCGGNRDRGKRPLMTRAVTELCDHAWATADNPRGESVDAIFTDMKTGVSNPERITFTEDRRWAIHLALEEAREGDAVLIAGKGHETYQEFADTVIPFDDRQVARELLNLKLNPQN
ncbi:MAG: UDP-N-acetylmuramoyl-L-alanyl-D-glutamate--2,6-diaminopimelate ligase [Opitutales bacterium]|nr:UDP-N-acetylmuramoyl-L-alanyl-D-glutamate--2,6-diaminopimelate ligase [Opitutales bacterium]